MRFVINILTFTHDMSKHRSTNEEIERLTQASSDANFVSEMDDRVSENLLLHDDDEDKNHQKPASGLDFI